MPLYDLTSPASGQTYRVNFDGDPQDADIEEAVRSFDAEEFAARGGEGDPNAAMQQGPVGTFINAVPQALAKFGTQALGGAAKIMGTATDYVAGVTGIKKGGFFDEAAQSYDAMTAEANRTFPTNPFNTKTATVGSGVGQGMAMLGGGAAARGLGMGGTALTTVPLVAGGLAGAGQGIDTAKEIGVQNPADQLAMGLLYGGVEVVTEKLGGFGNQAATEALLAPVKKSAAQLLKQAAKTTLSESGEEVLAEGAQALITRAYADEDPARPGFTKTGVELPKLDRKMADRLGLAALGGAAGGAVFAGVQTLADIQQPPALPADAQPTTAQRNRRPVEVVPAPPLSTLARIAAESVAPEGDTGALTAEDVANLEAEGSAGTPARMARPLPQPILQGLGQPITKDSEATADQTAQNTLGAGLSPATGSFSYNLTSPTTGQTYTVAFDREPQDTDLEETVAALDAEASKSQSLPPPRTPEQIAESDAAETARQSQVAKLRAQQNMVGRGPVIPDSPLGVYDILDFVNENKIRIPRADSKERNAAEYDWTETYSVPQYYRKFLGDSERGGSIDQVAQRAFEDGFIAQPTADALMGAISQTIDTRKQYKVQFAQQAKQQAVVEKQTLDFEKTQNTLRKKDKGRVMFEDIGPGDKMTIDGEEAVVKNIEYTEDGYLTNVVIEDGKRFGLMQFDPQTRSGLFVDEFTPKKRPGSTTTTATTPAQSQPAPATASPTAAAVASPPVETLVSGNALPQNGFENFNVNGTTAGFANAQILSEAADLIRQGITDFTNWSQAMLTRFGRGIQEYLAGVWQQVKDGAGDVLMSYLEKTGAVKNFQATEGKAISQAPAPNETQARFASPNAADRVINGPRTDEIVAAEAQDWLATLDTAAAVEAFASQQVPLPLDAAEHAAGVLIARLSDQATSGKTEVQRMWAHNAGLRMASIWTKEFLSADPARALRQRGVVNNTILAPIAPILAAQELLVDRADAIMDKRFEGGAAGATKKINAIVTKADTQAGETLADQLDGDMEEAPELGENDDLQTGPDPRIADLEARLKAMREQMAAGDAAMQETTGTWQKILELLNAASKRKSALLTGARSRMALARKAAQNRKAQRRAEGRLSANPVEDFADDAIIGTSFLAEGIVEFFNWGQAMIREVGARSNTELKQLYAAASKNYLDALKAEQAKPQKPTGKRTPAREKINKAQRTAQSILDELSRRYSDPPIFAEGQRKVNAMRELYKEHVKNPMPEATFVSRAQALGANVGTAGTLWEAATLEIEAREIMTREAMRAKLNPLLSQNSPALAKLLNTLRAKMFPGMKWSDIFMDLPASQKARQLEIYKRLMKDKRMAALAPHERLQLTNELDKAWQRERRKVFMRELEKAGVLGEKKAKDREKVKAAAPRLLRLMNLGMLNSEMFREALANEYGLKMIDAATAAELRAIGERIQKAPEGLPRRKLEQQLMERLQNLAGSTLWQVMDSWWTASVLSGWRTQVDIGLSIASGIEDVGLGSIVTALRTGNKDVALRGLSNLFARLPSAFMEAVDHVATGNKAMMRNFELEAKQAMEGGNRMASDVGAQMWRDGGWRKVPGGFMVFYGRLMTALDHINSASTREGAKAMALARHPELYQKALRISDADKQAARQQARLEMTGGAMPTTQQERLEETARMREILEQGIPTEVIAQATEIGRAAALQGEPTGLGGGLLDMVNAAVAVVARKAESMGKRPGLDLKSQQVLKLLQGTAPLVKAITGTKFARTVAHSINRNLSYVPGIGAYAVGQQGRTGAFGDILAAKQVIGTLVGIALYLAFDDDDDEKGIEDGWKDKTPQEKAQLYAQGKQPFSVWQRDDKGRVRSFNYQQWGVAGIMNTVAAMLKQKGSEAGTINVLMSSLVQGGMSFTDKAQLQGLQTVIGEKSRSTDPASGLAANLNKWAAQTVGGMIPRLVKDIDMVASPELRSSSEWWQKWAKEVPMLREISSGKRIDILGADILLDRGPLSRVTNLGTADPAYRMLGRLNEKDIWLPDPTQGVRVVKLNDGTRRPMTDAEKDRYQRLTGAAYRTFLGDYGPQLLQMEPTKAQDTISDITKRLRDRAAYQSTH